MTALLSDMLGEMDCHLPSELLRHESAGAACTAHAEQVKSRALWRDTTVLSGPLAVQSASSAASSHSGTNKLGRGDSDPAMRHGGARRTPMRVLVVDDNVDAASALALLAEIWGYEVRVAYSGIDALTILEDFVPHAALLDIGLPGMSGYALARRIRQNEASRHRRPALLVAVTGYGSSDDVKQAFLSGFDHHLVKPSDPDVMERYLDAHAHALQRPPGDTMN